MHENIGIHKGVYRNELQNLVNKATEKCITRNPPL